MNQPGYNLIWNEGIAAHNRGIPRWGNPYQNCMDNSGDAWERGWDKAEEAHNGPVSHDIAARIIT